MAGRPKQGIDYAGWSVDIFDGDKKIDKLLDAHAWDGFGVYFFLCQRAYKTGGYFYTWSYDDCATTARKMGGGIGSGTVKETVSYCLQIGLFDKGLFDRWGVLTSRGIQRRFWTVLSERRTKTVYKEYWLLDEEECKGLVKVSLKSDVQPTNDNVQPTNEHLQPIKKSKVNIDIYAADGFQNEELEKAFQLFVTCQQRNGRNLDADQISLLRQDLQKLGADDTERISIANKATMSGWRSFYPIRKKEQESRKQPVKQNRFNNFPQREYDYEQLEKELLDC